MLDKAFYLAILCGFAGMYVSVFHPEVLREAALLFLTFLQSI
jgi:hypothetical protein